MAGGEHSPPPGPPQSEGQLVAHPGSPGKGSGVSPRCNPPFLEFQVAFSWRAKGQLFGQKETVSWNKMIETPRKDVAKGH